MVEDLGTEVKYSVKSGLAHILRVEMRNSQQNAVKDEQKGRNQRRRKSYLMRLGVDEKNNLRQ